MGLFDFLKFAKTSPETKHNLTTIQKLTNWTDAKDFGIGASRRELRKLYLDDEICAATDTRKEACISSDWSITGGDEKLNLQTWDIMKNLIPSILNYSWWAIPYGYSVIQIIWKNESGKLIPDQVIDQPFESFGFDQEGNITFLNNSTKLTPYKYFTTFRNKSFYSPSGEALYQRLYQSYYYRLNAWEFWIQYLESWGKPFIHAKSDSTDNQTIEFLKSLVGIKRPRGMITNKDVDLQVVQASGNVGTTFKDFEQALSQRIQRLILGQTLTSGAGDVGSQALGVVHNQVRDDKRISDCKLLEITVQNVINSYFLLNNLNGDIPQFKFNFSKNLKKDLAERDNILLSQGVRHTTKYYEENYDFDPEDFEIVAPAAAKPAAFKFGATTDAQIKTENSAIENSANVFTEKELKHLFKVSKNRDDLEKNLNILLGKPSGKFEEDVTKSLLMANVEGFGHGSEGD